MSEFTFKTPRAPGDTVWASTGVRLEWDEPCPACEYHEEEGIYPEEWETKQGWFYGVQLKDGTWAECPRCKGTGKQRKRGGRAIVFEAVVYRVDQYTAYSGFDHMGRRLNDSSHWYYTLRGVPARAPGFEEMHIQKQWLDHELHDTREQALARAKGMEPEKEPLDLTLNPGGVVP